jgi:predicted dehydrogenase
MDSVSPIVDCAVHYVDVMADMCESEPREVRAMGARLSADLPPGMYNYGQLQVRFEDGSVGWYEAGWGPMMSGEASFLREAVGPLGSVTMTDARTLVVHRARLGEAGELAEPDESVPLPDDPTLVELCRRQQEMLLQAIAGRVDLAAHHAAVLRSLEIVLAADRAIRDAGSG